MAGPRPDDSYNPVPTVTPSTTAPNDYLTTRASPEAFGAQRGEATQRLGSTMNQAGGEVVNTSLQQLGLANEHSANMADMQLAVDGGKIYDSYKSLAGLDAANSKDHYVQSYLEVSNKIRQSLPNAAAQRAYDSVATRRMSFTIQDMNSYAATQTQQAYRTGRVDSIKLAQDQANNYSVADNDSQFGFNTGGIIHDLNAAYTAPDYGKYQTVKAETQADGKLKFNTDTIEGQIAQNDYDNALNTELGKAWENRGMTLALGDGTHPGSVVKALEMINQHKDEIPSATRIALQSKLSGPYKAEQGREISDTNLSAAHDDYINSTPSQAESGPTEAGMKTLITGLIPGITVTSQGRTPSHNAEVGGVPDSQHLNDTALDFTLPAGATFEDFKAQLKTMGVKTTELINEGNHVHVAWGVKGSTGKTYNSFTDYLGDHSADLIQKSRDDARDRGFDITVQDEAASRMRTRIEEAQYAQSQQVKSVRNSIIGKISDPKNLMTSEAMLDNSADPALKREWVNLQALDPLSAEAIRNVIKANASGMSSSYGTQFYDHLSKALDGTYKSPGDFQDYIGGSKAPVSNSGFTVIDRAMKDNATPEGQAFNQQEKTFLDTVRSHFVSPMPGISAPALESNFEAQVQSLVPLINAGKASGKTVGDLFNEKSPDYVGKGVKYPSVAEIQAAIGRSILSGVNTNTSSSAAMNYNSLGDLQKAVRSDPSLRKQAEVYALQKGWIAPPPPSVPLPQ